MKKVTVTLNALSLTLPAICQGIRDGVLNRDWSILVLDREQANALESAIDCRDNICEVRPGAAFHLDEAYGYGFDAGNEERSYEIEVNDLHPSISGVLFTVVNLKDQLALMQDAPPPVDVVTEIALPDVTAISSDELLKVVANYDTIHAAAIKELNGRLGGVADKLGIEVKAE